ncbi:hypothetical protein OHT93_10915 [Streptomyces sp. NBC_00191]|uniref:hypothetical protein n=1 Tax=Streptomyces sp. NBC_00191 TaxID=2975674 RepID=UPI00324D9396
MEQAIEGVADTADADSLCDAASAAFEVSPVGLGEVVDDVFGGGVPVRHGA